MLDFTHVYTIDLKNSKNETEVTKCKIISYDEDSDLYTISPYGIGTVIKDIAESLLTDIS